MAAQQQINFTRDNEMEADRVGIGYLAGAGFDANAMGGFFETMSRHEGLAATYIPAMLIDHPVTTDRIAEAQGARGAVPAAHRARLAELRADPRARAGAHHAAPTSICADTYERKIARGEADLADRYGYALTLLRQPRRARR